MNRTNPKETADCSLQNGLLSRVVQYYTNDPLQYVTHEKICEDFKNHYDVRVVGHSIYFIENGLYRKEAQNEVAAKTYVMLCGDTTNVLFLESDSEFECVRERLLADPELKVDLDTYYLIPIETDHYYCAKRTSGIDYDLILLQNPIKKNNSTEFKSNYDEIVAFVKNNFEASDDESFYASISGYELYKNLGGTLSRNVFYRHFVSAIKNTFSNVESNQKRAEKGKGKNAKRGVFGVAERKK